MSFTNQQTEALARVQKWFTETNDQVYKVFGYAGTGKTTLAKFFADNIQGYTQYGAFTGKACQVLRNKGCYNAATLHSMIYKADTDKDGITKFILNVYDSPLKNAALAIVDEVSMVDEELAADLLKLAKRVLVLGDPAQLPPVRGSGYFMEGKPDVMLTEVHRQAADNPIIALSMSIREGRGLRDIAKGDPRLQLVDFASVTEAKEADQVICGINRTRETKNRRMRELLGFKGQIPQPGERLICLKNNSSNGLFNGQMWELKEIRERAAYTDEYKNKLPDHLELHAKSLDSEAIVSTRVMKELFEGGYENIHWRMKKNFDEFAFGYVVTCHKSQGSQWDNVLLYDESHAFPGDEDRWLYTAVTRAAEKLMIVRR